MLLNNQWVKEEIKRNKIPWDKWNGNTTYQNLWDKAKAVLGGKYILINAYLKKQEKSQTA